MKYVVSSLKTGSVYRFASWREARKFVISCFEMGSNDVFVLVETGVA